MTGFVNVSLRFLRTTSFAMTQILRIFGWSDSQVETHGKIVYNVICFAIAIIPN